MHKFEELLHEYGKVIGTPLHPEKERLCKLHVNDVLYVQLEYEENKDRLLIASFVSELPPGKFRENIFREALKSNSLLPHLGELAYCERNNTLVLFTYLPLASLTGAKLNDTVNAFIEKADLWRVAVETGQLGPIIQAETLSSTPRPFGLS